MALNLGTVQAQVTVNNAQYLTGMQQVSQATTSTASSITKTLGTALGVVGVAGLLKSAASASMEFGEAISNIRSLATELSLEDIAASINKISPVLGRGKDLAEAYYYAYSAGIRGTAGDLGEFTTEVAKGAKAIRAQLVPTMDAVTTIMNAYGLSVKDAGYVSDILFQTVKQGKTTGELLAGTIGQVAGTAGLAKLPLEELGAALGTLTRTLPTSMAVTSLNNALLSMIQPTREAKDAAAALGIELSATSLQAMGLGGKIAEINAKAGDNVEAITAMFGNIRAFRAIATLAGEQAGTFAKMLVEFNSMGGGALEAFRIQTDNTYTTWNTAMTEMGSSLRSFGDSISPAVEKAAKGISAVSTGFKEAQQDSDKSFSMWALGIGIVASKVLGFAGKMAAAPPVTFQTASLQGFNNVLSMTSLRTRGLIDNTSLLQKAGDRAAVSMSGSFNAIRGGATGLSGVLTSLGNVALLVGVAAASWEFGKWMGEITGVTNAVAGLTEKLGLFNDKAAGARAKEADTALGGREASRMKQWAAEVGEAGPELAAAATEAWTKFDEARKAGNEEAARRASEDMRKLLEQVRSVAKEKPILMRDDYAEMLNAEGIGSQLRTALGALTAEERGWFRERAKELFQEFDLSQLTTEQVNAIVQGTADIRAAVGKTQAAAVLKDAKAGMDFMLADFAKQRADIEMERIELTEEGGVEEGAKAIAMRKMLDQMETEKAYFYAESRRLEREAAAAEAAGQTEATAKLRAELATRLKNYQEIADEIKQTQEDIAAASPAAKAVEGLKQYGSNIFEVRRKFIEGMKKGGLVTPEMTKEFVTGAFKPEETAQIEAMTKKKMETGISEKSARERAIQAMTDKLEKQGKLTQGDLDQMVVYLSTIAAAAKNPTVVKFYTGNL